MKITTLQYIHVGIILMVLFFAGKIFAQESILALPEPGLTADSPMYVFEQIKEGIITLFVVDPVAKVERYSTLADERLAEALFLSQDPTNSNAIETTTMRYLRQYNAATAMILDPNSLMDLVTQEKLKITLALNALRNGEVLATIGERVPTVSYAMSLVSDQTIAKQVALISSIANTSATRATDIFALSIDTTTASIEKQTSTLQGTRDISRLDASIKDFNSYVDLGNALVQKKVVDVTSIDPIISNGVESITQSLINVQNKGFLVDTLLDTTRVDRVSTDILDSQINTKVQTFSEKNIYRQEGGISWQDYIFSLKKK